MGRSYGGSEIAAVIIEPVGGHANRIPPCEGDASVIEATLAAARASGG